LDNFEAAKSILRRFGLRRTAWDSLQELAKKYGIEIVPEWRLKDGPVTSEKIGQFHLQPAFELLNNELKVYSTSMLKTTRLKRIVLCSKVRIKRGIFEGQSGSKKNSRVCGIFVGKSGNLYLPLDWFSGSHSRHTFHHELYHCIDYHRSFWRYWDPGWALLNEKGFSYSREKYEGREIEYPRRVGFISTYAMTDVWEDKAELYASMILHYKYVVTKCDQDTVLKKKFLRIKELLLRFCPEYNDAFWKSRENCSITVWDDHTV
jgi:hypothetical protein